MRRLLVCALAALAAGCGGVDHKADGQTDPLSAARAAIISRNFADAADDAQTAIDADPDQPDAYFELARAEALRGNGGSAEDALAKALDKGLGDASQKLADPAFEAIRADQRFVDLQRRASPATAATNRQEPEPAVEISDDQVRAGDVVINTDF